MTVRASRTWAGCLRSQIGPRRRQLFRVEEFYLMILCTDEVKAFIEERGFTNIGFLEYGNIVD